MAKSVLSADSLKEAGNVAFASKKFYDAIESYSRALDTKPSDTMIATLLSNRAAAFLNLNNYQNALEDCNMALEIDPGRDKALFRRAQAYESIGETAKAFSDLKQVLYRDPTNRSVVAAARRCKEQLERDSGGRLPVVSALERLRELSTGSVTDRLALLRSFISLTHDDSAAAMTAIRAGAWTMLWPMLNATDDKEVRN